MDTYTILTLTSHCMTFITTNVLLETRVSHGHPAIQTRILHCSMHINAREGTLLNDQCIKNTQFEKALITELTCWAG